MEAVKLRAIASHLPIGSPVAMSEFSHGAIASGPAGTAAWVEHDAAADAALLWWTRRAFGAPLVLVGPRPLGRVARRVTGLAVAVWEVADGVVRPVVPDAPIARVAVPSAHEVHAASIERCGAQLVREHGVLSGEVLGLEVCRVTADDLPRLEIGVGAIDRETFGLVHAGRDPDASLREVVATVRAARSDAHGNHPLARLATARLLRWRALTTPTIVGASTLSPAEPPRPRCGISVDEPCVATGIADDGAPIVVVFAALADPGAVPFAIDARLRESPDARAVIAVLEGNVTGTMAALAAVVRPAMSFVEVPRSR